MTQLHTTCRSIMSVTIDTTTAILLKCAMQWDPVLLPDTRQKTDGITYYSIALQYDIEYINQCTRADGVRRMGVGPLVSRFPTKVLHDSPSYLSKFRVSKDQWLTFAGRDFATSCAWFMLATRFTLTNSRLDSVYLTSLNRFYSLNLQVSVWQHPNRLWVGCITDYMMGIFESLVASFSL